MPVITLFSGSYCHGEEVARRAAEMLGYKTVDDRSLISETARRFKVEKYLWASTKSAAVYSKVSTLSRLTLGTASQAWRPSQ